jgi:hypothetical protein
MTRTYPVRALWCVLISAALLACSEDDATNAADTSGVTDTSTSGATDTGSTSGVTDTSTSGATDTGSTSGVTDTSTSGATDTGSTSGVTDTSTSGATDTGSTSGVTDTSTSGATDTGDTSDTSDAPPIPTDHRAVLLINAGADAAFTDHWGRRWEADQGWADGDITTHPPDAVMGAPIPTLFETARGCVTAYSLPIADGTYTVRLHFAEQSDQVTTVGQRMSDVTVEGRLVSRFDPLYAARGPRRAVTLTWEGVEVSDGALDLSFAPQVGCATLNAIEVLARLDNACDLSAPPRHWWPDADGDGLGDLAATPTVSACSPPAPFAHVTDAGDCDDQDPAPTPSASCRFIPAGCDAWISPSDDAAAVVASGAPGTHYCFRAGMHRLSAPIQPRDGDRFTGEPGVTLSGARDVSASTPGWTDEGGGVWCLSGQDQDLSGGFLATNFTHSPGGNPGDLYPEELFSNDQRLSRVLDRADLAPGRWLLDTTNDQLCVAQDPSTLGRLETSVISHAFSGRRVSDVVIDNLTLEKFASAWRTAIIGGWFQSPGFDWTVRHVELRWSHSTGVNNMPGLTVENTRIYGLGHMAINGPNIDNAPGNGTGYRAPMVLRDSELFDNNALNFDWGNEGAFKLSDCDDCRVERCWVHDVSHGPGIWYDVNNRGSLIQGNLVESTREHGIFYEISYLGEIAYNIVRDVGAPHTRGDLGMAIYVSSSRDVEVHHNVTYGNMHELFIRAEDRGTGDDGPWEPTGTHMHHNRSQIIDGAAGLRVRAGVPQDAAYMTPPFRGILFADNTYYVLNLTSNKHYWGISGGGGPGAMNASAWSTMWGASEVFISADPPATPSPEGPGPWFSFSDYGPRP